MTRPLLLSSFPARGDRIFAGDGTSFVIEGELGRGGQGAVFSLQTPVGGQPMCAKVYLGLDDARAERTRARLERLRQLSATPALVLPRRVLRAPWTGHVMDRVVDAQSFGTLAQFPGGEPIRDWYARTGGLRRRLLLGLALCDAFRDLHLKGLAYCDLSFDNVLAATKGAPAIRLIDCDNLTVDGAGPAVQGTPWFIAPEILAETHRPDRETDAHSLAVLLYHLIVLAHPLLGDAIRNGPPEGEELALRGIWPGGPLPITPDARSTVMQGRALPWIDAEDPRNRSQAGLPRDLVLSPGMRETFARAFGRGLHERTARPTEGKWAEVLGRAVDAVMSCTNCKNQRWLSAAPCFWCKATASRPGVLYCAYPEGRRPVVVEAHRRLFPRHLLFRQSALGEDALAQVSSVRGTIVLESLTDEVFAVTEGAEGGRTRAVRRGERASLKQGDSFQLGERAVRVTVHQVGVE